MECGEKIHGAMYCAIRKALSVSKMFLSSFTFFSSFPKKLLDEPFTFCCHPSFGLYFLLSHPSKPCDILLLLTMKLQTAIVCFVAFCI